MTGLRNLTADPDAVRRIWVFHLRAPGNNRLAEMIEAVTGPDWTHYGYYVDDVLTVGISLQKHRELGVELHLAASVRATGRQVLAAVKAIGNKLAAISPDIRVIVWVAEVNKTARRLAARFLTYETTMLEPRTNLELRRYSTTGADWMKIWEAL
jgi:hypothetical protein